MNDVATELLSPAGDMERLRAAVDFGADAVYLAASRWGMRTASKNFDTDELREGIVYAHNHGVKVYIACNILMRNQDLDMLYQDLDDYCAAGVDAVIVGDLGALRAVRGRLPVHISVQMGATNYETVRYLYELGAARVVLARELSLDEIAEIRAKTPPELELEAFVHGSMCMSYSGRCLLSDYMAGRSANRGDCVQPCRWKYRLVEETRPGEYFPIEEDEGTHILNAKDLCMLEYLPAIVQSGVTSLKIEGRAKSAYYTAVITAAYRRALDAWRVSGYRTDYIVPQEILNEMNKVSHRAYSTGFYLGRPQQGQCQENGGYIRDYQVAGVVQSYENGMITVSQRNKILRGAVLDVLEPRGDSYLIQAQELYDLHGKMLESTPHAQMIYQIPVDRPVKPGALLRIQK